MRIKNKRKLLLGVAVGFVAGVVLFQLVKPKPDKEECEIVDGKTHIYKGECLPEGYKPKTLVPLAPRYCWLDTGQELDVRAAISVMNLIDDAQEDGMCLVVASGYRSYEDQLDLYQYADSDYHEKVAKPGTSEHQTGLAVDFVACPMNENGKRDDSIERPELEKPFNELPEFYWLKNNAWKYDFGMTYRDDNQEVSGYPPEPWHWKMVIK